MKEELNYLKTIGITKREEVTDETFMLCKTKFGFITDLANITEGESPSVFVIPKTTTEFEYAQDDQIDNAIALTSEEYFDFIFGRFVFLDELNGIIEVSKAAEDKSNE